MHPTVSSDWGEREIPLSNCFRIAEGGLKACASLLAIGSKRPMPRATLSDQTGSPTWFCRSAGASGAGIGRAQVLPEEYAASDGWPSVSSDP